MIIQQITEEDIERDSDVSICRGPALTKYYVPMTTSSFTVLSANNGLLSLLSFVNL